MSMYLYERLVVPDEEQSDLALDVGRKMVLKLKLYYIWAQRKPFEEFRQRSVMMS